MVDEWPLATCSNKTPAAYKFQWLLGVLAEVKGLVGLF